MSVYTEMELEKIRELVIEYGGIINEPLSEPENYHIFNSFMKLIKTSIGVDKFIKIVKNKGNYKKTLNKTNR